MRNRRHGLVKFWMVTGVAFAIASLGLAKDKKTLPTMVLKARTVCVLIDPNAGTPVDDPLANKKAQEDVEKALMKWGRFQPIMEPGNADLIIVIRTGNGKIVRPTVGGVNTNDRPVIVQPTDNGIRLGGKRGQPPGDTQQAPQDTNPHPQMEMGPTEDTFLVYEGKSGAIDPTERAPLWRLQAKKALKSPDVPAVAEFKKAVDEAEKQQKAQQQGKP
jgi:hypothetical protein